MHIRDETGTVIQWKIMIASARVHQVRLAWGSFVPEVEVEVG